MEQTVVVSGAFLFIWRSIVPTTERSAIVYGLDGFTTEVTGVGT